MNETKTEKDTWYFYSHFNLTSEKWWRLLTECFIMWWCSGLLSPSVSAQYYTTNGDFLPNKNNWAGWRSRCSRCGDGSCLLIILVIRCAAMQIPKLIFSPALAAGKQHLQSSPDKKRTQENWDIYWISCLYPAYSVLEQYCQLSVWCSAPCQWMMLWRW